MEDVVNLIVDIVTRVGFPIAVAVFLLWYVKDTNERHKDEISTMNTEHRAYVERLDATHHEEVQKLSDAVHNNTVVVEKLLTLFEEHFDEKGG